MTLIVPCLQLNGCHYHLLSNKTTAHLTRLIYVEYNLGNITGVFSLLLLLHFQFVNNGVP